MKKMAIAMTVILLLGLLGGCGKKEAKVPKLEDPKSNDKVVCEVIKQNISNEEMHWGAISPLITYVTVPKTGVISEMVACPGERVKKGDVLLRYDTKDVTEQLEDLKNQQESFRKTTDSQVTIYQYQIQQKKLEMEDVKQNQKIETSGSNSEDGSDGDVSGKGEDKGTSSDQSNNKTEYAKKLLLLQTQIEGINDSITYERNNFSSQNTIYQSQIAVLQKEIDESEIKAPSNGYVMSYIGAATSKDSTEKQLEIGTSVDKNSLLAWFADEDVPVIEVADDDDMDKIIKESDFTDDTIRTFYTGDKQYDLSLYQYDAQQQDIMSTAKVNKQLQYVINDPNELEIGLTGIVSFSSKKKENVLAVPVSAVEKDKDNKFFVYKQVNGKQEKTFIEIGGTTKEYYEVTDGLKEGDHVVYTECFETEDNGDYSGKTTKETMKASLGTIDNSMDEDLYSKISPTYINVVNMNLEGKEGVVSKLPLALNDPVKKGQVVAYTDAKTPASELSEMKENIDQQKDVIAQAQKDYDDTVDGINAQMDLANTDNEKKSYELDKKIALVTKNQTVYDANIQLKDLNETYDKLVASKDGTPVYSTIDGYVSCNVVNENAVAQPGGAVVKVASRKNCYANLNENGDMLQLGRRITFTDKDGKEYHATVICSQAALSNDKNAKGIYGDYGALIRFDEEDISSSNQFVHEKYDAPGVSNVLVLPRGAYDARVQAYNSDDVIYVIADYSVTILKKDGTKEKRKIQVSPAGEKTNNRWIVSGLTEGETVQYIHYSEDN